MIVRMETANLGIRCHADVESMIMIWLLSCLRVMFRVAEVRDVRVGLVVCLRYFGGVAGNEGK
jgi:hypothetical protein